MSTRIAIHDVTRISIERGYLAQGIDLHTLNIEFTDESGAWHTIVAFSKERLDLVDDTRTDAELGVPEPTPDIFAETK